MSKKNNNFFRNNHTNHKTPGVNSQKPVPRQTNQECYNKNIQAIKKRYPELVLKLENVNVDKNYSIKLTGTKKTPNLYSVNHNKYYYDEEDPFLDVENQISSLEIKNPRLAVFLGFGLGYEFKYYMEKIFPKYETKHILIVENDIEIFHKALQIINISDIILNPGIEFFIAIDQENLFNSLFEYFRGSSRIIFLKAIQNIYHSSSLILNKDYYMNFIRKMKESAVFTLNFYGNDPKDSLIGIENMIENIEEIVKNPGINLLYNKFKGKPAIIASTGPSLNKNKHLLKGIEDKALIITPDASLKPLLEIGVKPHMITSLERVELLVKLIEGFEKEEVKDIFYTACPVVPKRSYEVYQGPKIIVYRNFDHFKWLNVDRGILDIKHSSGNMAFKIATALGCDPIILIGQDLAYSKEGKSHALGATLGENQVNDKVDKFEVVGNDGQPILTNSTWNEFRIAYELDIKQYDGRCINSTEGGAFIQGTEVMSFADAINKFINVSFNPLDIIKENLSKFELANEKSDIHKLLSTITETLVDLNRMQKLCKKGYDYIQDNIEILSSYLMGENKDCKGDPKTIEIIHGKVFKYKHQVGQNNRTMQLFLMHIVQSFYIKFEMDIQTVYGKYDHELMVKAEITISQRKWFSTMNDIIELCINLLENTKEKLDNIKID